MSGVIAFGVMLNEKDTKAITATTYVQMMPHTAAVDVRCGNLDYIRGEGRDINCRYMMSNNFAFGGINTSIIFKRWDA